MATSGSALSAIHVWLVCGSQHRVYSGKSDVRPRRRANPKNVALFLHKIYRAGKNSKAQVEKVMFPLVRMAQSAGRHDTKQGEVESWASQQVSRALTPLCPSLAL